jgi:hypothetical protein
MPYIDEKVTVWRRTYFADDRTKILPKLQEGYTVNGLIDEGFMFGGSEYDSETEDFIQVEDNDNYSTIEFYDDDGALLYQNGE